jgi:hypothetical protein
MTALSYDTCLTTAASRLRCPVRSGNGQDLGRKVRGLLQRRTQRRLVDPLDPDALVQVFASNSFYTGINGTCLSSGQVIKSRLYHYVRNFLRRCKLFHRRKLLLRCELFCKHQLLRRCELFQRHKLLHRRKLSFSRKLFRRHKLFSRLKLLHRLKNRLKNLPSGSTARTRCTTSKAEAGP